MTEKMQSSDEIEEPIEQSGDPVKSDSPNGEETITVRRAYPYAIVFILIFIVGFGLGFLVRDLVSLPGIVEVIANRNPAESETSPVSAEAQSQPPNESSPDSAESQPQSASDIPQVVRYEIPVDDDPMLGLSDAPITIVEFSDYECPYCRRWHTDVYPKLLETYGDQIRFVYRDFPLESIHANAQPAAEAANCAYEQGVFWEYHDKLFGMELGLSSQAYQEYASQLELDAAEFQECIESGRYQEEVQSDFEFAANLGVRSTPTFFINGIAVVGAQPFEVFQQVIERELAGEIP